MARNKFAKPQPFARGNAIQNANAYLVWLLREYGPMDKYELAEEFYKLGYRPGTLSYRLLQCKLAGAIRFDEDAELYVYVRSWNGKQKNGYVPKKIEPMKISATK